MVGLSTFCKRKVGSKSSISLLGDTIRIVDRGERRRRRHEETRERRGGGSKAEDADIDQGLRSAAVASVIPYELRENDGL